MSRLTKNFVDSLLKHRSILLSVGVDRHIVAFDKLLVLARLFAICLSVLGSHLFANDLDLGICGAEAQLLDSHLLGSFVRLLYRIITVRRGTCMLMG